MISRLTAKAAILVASPASHFLPGSQVLFGYGNKRAGYAVDIIISLLLQLLQHLLQDLAGTLFGHQAFVDCHRTDKGKLVIVHSPVTADPSGIHSGFRIIECGIKGRTELIELSTDRLRFIRQTKQV